MARKKSETQQEQQVETSQSQKLTLSNPAELTTQKDRQPEVRKLGKFTIITY
jgi:hypothetical protein